MAAKNKPYEEFGQFLLFKRLEADAFSELWRAGRIDGDALGAVVAVRRFTGGDRDAMAAATRLAEDVVAQLNGTSFVREQTFGVIDGVPFMAHDYAGGRSLRHIVERARGTAGNSPNPIPIDQAIAVAEKVALSLATTAELRSGGDRLVHGALVPQLVWITDDGETRVGGQMLGPGFLASMSDSRVAGELARYFAPELLQSGTPTKASEVFAMGAMLYLLATGLEPPDASNASAFGQAVVAAKMLSGAPVPTDIRALLARSLALDPAMRYPSVAEMKQAISALAHGGQYSATTFNLAFYVSSLLKKEMEGEALEREREMKVSLTPYLASEAAPIALGPDPVAHAQTPSMFVAPAVSSKNHAPLAVAAVVALAAIGAAGYYMFARKSGRPGAEISTPTVTAQMLPAARTKLVSQPLVAAAPGTAPAVPTDTASADAASKKAFEQAVEQKLQEEMMKLQQDYTKKLQLQQSRQAPAPVAAVTAVTRQSGEETAPSASQLDQQHLTSRPLPPPVAQGQVAAVASPLPVTQTVAPTLEPAAAVVHEGDVVEVNILDAIPHVIHAAAPVYPVMAMRQRVETTVIITALISETGEVVDAKVLRGDRRFGFEDSALRAVRATRFTVPLKDGKRVRTWFPVPVTFKL